MHDFSVVYKGSLDGAVLAAGKFIPSVNFGQINSIFNFPFPSNV